MIHLEGRETSKVVKSCDTCKHDEAFGCPSFIHDRCENYSEWEQADGDLTTALCSLPKIISEDGQDYVQLADVLEAVRRYKPQTDGDLISRQALLDAFGFSEKTRKWGGDHSGYNTMMLYEIQNMIESAPPIKPQEKTGHWEEVGEEYIQVYDLNGIPSCGDERICSECGFETVFIGEHCSQYKYCPNCGCRMVDPLESEGMNEM